MDKLTQQEVDELISDMADTDVSGSVDCACDDCVQKRQDMSLRITRALVHLRSAAQWT